MEPNRNFNLDIIKLWAILSVFCVHFFLNTNFYITPIYGKSMIIQLFIRNSLMVCVPLFLLITGYLYKKYDYISDKYFVRLKRILFVWLFYTFLATMFNLFWLKSDLNIKEIILSILNFEANSYAWYINLFIGLYVLAPVVNAWIDKTNKKDHLVFIVLVGLISILPDTFINTPLRLNNFYLTLYPIFYYLTGAYIYKYRPKIKLTANILIISFFLILPSLIQLLISPGKWIGFIDSYGSFNIAIASIFVFIFLINLKINKTNAYSLLPKFTSLSLDMFMAGYFSDKIVYNYFLEKSAYIGQSNYLKFMPILVLCSLLIASIISITRRSIFNFYNKLSNDMLPNTKDPVVTEVNRS